MSWFILNFLAVFSIAAAELFQQRILNKEKPLSPRASSVLGYSIQTLMILPFALFYHSRDFLGVFSSGCIILFLAVTVVGSFAVIFYLKSLQVENISLSGIFGSFSIAVSTVLGIYFFGESVTWMKFLGIGLILIAILSFNFKNTILEKNHYFGIIAGVLFGICYTLDKGLVENIPPIVYIFWNFLFLAIFAFLANPKEIIDSIKLKLSGVYKLTIATGFFYLLFNVLTFTAYTVGGEVGKVDAINNGQVFLVILFEYFILKHRGSIGRKFIAAAIAFAGILILGIYR